MTELAKQTLAILQQVAEFLEGLTAEHLNDIAEGRTKITYIPWQTGAPVKPPDKVARVRMAKRPASDMSEIRDTLYTMNDRNEARAYLDQFRLEDLRELSSLLSMGKLSKDVKAVVIDKIVERTVGNPLISGAMRGS